MLFDMETLEAQQRYKILAATVTPRPIAWVTTLSDDGVINAAPCSFFNVLGTSRRRLRSGVQDMERCYIDTRALQLIGRMHGSGWYARCTDLFQLDRPGLGRLAAKRRAPTGVGAMSTMALRLLAAAQPSPPATFVALATGTIVLAFRAVRELWCRPLGYGPKVLIGPFGSCLLPARDFAHKIRQVGPDLTKAQASNGSRTGWRSK